ncbi:eukaryotic translation initiation factor 3 subunit A-like [Ptychodera flava]|uniref:eukaryotic translation initiation factor 3 subunit A-like n=1 Tax=Ptychodera flava TaxID=63121 RepID=UPI00396A9261
MPTYFQRPENALKRANEFIDVGKKQPALDALYDVIKSKKHRTWQKIHEPIMEKYLQLCVDLRKSHIAKEGLYQYKNICQQVNIKSLEDVVRSYLKLAEEKTEAAKEESKQMVDDIDDLDQITTPESLLLSAVSGEDTHDRTDRVLLTPWVKFLWESYRQCLDLLRNNTKVERLYQDIAQQAFRFCHKYTRKTEFRKLCENLRNHLGLITKYQNQASSINLNNPESQAMHLETRLVQLDNAISMELWQEAYKAIEDVHGLMTLSKKPPKPQLMANYYQKLGLVFWKSGNYLFHACALHRLLQLSREQRKNLSSDEIQRMASRVLLATLSIQIIQPRSVITSILDMREVHAEKQRKLANLLGLQSAPTRSQLIKDLVKYNVVQHVLPQLKDLFLWLEVEFHPLTLSDKVTKILDFLQEANELELGQYVPALQDVTLTRLVKQVSQVYQTIQFSRLMELAKFTTEFHLEKIIVEASRSGALQVQIDHRTKALHFGADLCVSTGESDELEGPHLQAMPSEQIKSQLSQMSAALQKGVQLINPSNIQTERADQRQIIVQSFLRSAKKEHQRILARRLIIEERKEHLESLNTQREKEEQELIEQQKRAALQAEHRRLEREAEEREKRRRQEEHRQIQQKQTLDRIESLKKTAIGARTLKKLDIDELKDMDADEIMAKQVQQLEHEKRELQLRLKTQEKKIDYTARAQRLEEIPLLKNEAEENAVKDREKWDQQEEERITRLSEERELAKKERDRLSKLTQEKDKFLNSLKEARQSVYQEKLARFEKEFAEERERRLQDRKEKRKEERRKKWCEEKEEEEQRKKDEEAIREREREEAEKQALQEKEEEEYRERLAKLEEQAAKQRAREREIEEKLSKKVDEKPARDRDGDRRGPGWGREDRDSGRDSWRGSSRTDEPPRERSGPWKPSVREGGWREREKERDNTWLRKPQEPNDDRHGPDDFDGRRPPPDDFDRRRPPMDDRDRRRPPMDDDRRRPYADDRDIRGPPPSDGDRRPDNDDRDRYGSRPDDRDRRGPPPDERDRRGPYDDRDRRGPPPDDRDRRGPYDDRDRRGPPPERDWRQRDDRDRRGPPDDRAWRRDDGPSRGPPRERDDQWRRPRDDDSEWRSRGPPSRGPPRDERFSDDRDWRRGDDRGPPPRGPPRGERDRWGDRDDRGPPPRGPPRDDRDRRGPPEGRSWRDMPRDRDMKRDDRGPPSRDRVMDRDDRRSRNDPPERVRKPPRESEPQEDGWTTVTKR